LVRSRGRDWPASAASIPARGRRVAPDVPAGPGGRRPAALPSNRAAEPNRSSDRMGRRRRAGRRGRFRPARCHAAQPAGRSTTAVQTGCRSPRTLPANNTPHGCRVPECLGAAGEGRRRHRRDLGAEATDHGVRFVIKAPARSVTTDSRRAIPLSPPRKLLTRVPRVSRFGCYVIFRRHRPIFEPMTAVEGRVLTTRACSAKRLRP
jgi:hypothetical protein